MKQKYLFSFLLFSFLMLAIPANAQDSISASARTEISIDGLSIYPNPITGGRVFISSTKNQEKKIEIYNVLGKPVLKTRLRGRELDVSSLTPGIYIIKIEEGRSKATRKIVVK